MEILLDLKTGQEDVKTSLQEITRPWVRQRQWCLQQCGRHWWCPHSSLGFSSASSNFALPSEYSEPRQTSQYSTKFSSSVSSLQVWQVSKAEDVVGKWVFELFYSKAVSFYIVSSASGLATVISLPLNTWIISLESDATSFELRQKLCSVHVVVRLMQHNFLHSTPLHN